jgi:cytochrome P450
MGRSPAVWKNPLEFDPERFVNEPEIDVRGQDFRLIPFGSGRRACPAITLATLSVQWATAMLVHSFEWSLPPGESCKDLDMTEIFGLTTPRAIPLVLHATPRLQTHSYAA